jgi:hypothetical protein
MKKYLLVLLCALGTLQVQTSGAGKDEVFFEEIRKCSLHSDCAEHLNDCMGCLQWFIHVQEVSNQKAFKEQEQEQASLWGTIKQTASEAVDMVSEALDQTRRKQVEDALASLDLDEHVKIDNRGVMPDEFSEERQLVRAAKLKAARVAELEKLSRCLVELDGQLAAEQEVQDDLTVELEHAKAVRVEAARVEAVKRSAVEKLGQFAVSKQQQQLKNKFCSWRNTTVVEKFVEFKQREREQGLNALKEKIKTARAEVARLEVLAEAARAEAENFEERELPVNFEDFAKQELPVSVKWVRAINISGWLAAGVATVAGVVAVKNNPRQAAALMRGVCKVAKAKLSNLSELAKVGIESAGSICR